ncbi:MAG: CBS domain-containing protein [Candidatus Methanoperedens sp.]|nr:CBS domain-containing protein [Candidatus Methanoperedens sp.]MCE8424993.1 CBS domain-containing protein [Candidatus Methanoperedens sp.]MCE8427427.1 CBS domain-containing protein [Candidatus Methanoperedens sp.]
MELSPIQKEILTALINLYREKKQAIKGEDIADVINRNPGTVRNQMQSLKALGLVEGVPGPKGGYKATGETYRALCLSELEKETVVPIRRNEEIILNATAAEISFTTVRHPDLCNATVHVIGDIRKFELGNTVTIGPTPVNKMVIKGEVIGRDDTKNTLLFVIQEMISLPKKPVKLYLREQPITIPAIATIQEASRILVDNKIHGAPVRDKTMIVGIVTLTDIGKTLADGKTSLKIKDIMTKKIISVDGEMPLHEVVRVFNKEKVGRLLVRSEGEFIGLISKTDILDKIILY